MATYGVTPTGFNRKPLNIILEERKAELKNIFGENLDLTAESPDGEIVGVYAEAEADIWEIAEACYNAFDPDSAVRDQLSVLMTLSGIERLEEAGGTMFQEFTGVSGTLILSGSLIKLDSITGSDLQFETLTNITIPPSGSIVAQIQCTTFGPISVAIGTANVIETPVSGWASTTNVTEATGGTFEETDPAARSRRKRSVALSATNILDAIFANIANIDGVTGTVVLENKTGVTDANLTLPYSIHAIVEGGTDSQVATAIFQKLNGGCNMTGDVSVDIIDDQGFPQPFLFSRPTAIPIFVVINITVGSGYPATGDDLIKQAVVDYSAGEFPCSNTDGFGIGDDVINNELFIPATLATTGYKVNSVETGLTLGGADTSDIPIALTEKSEWSILNIQVNHV